MPAYEFSPALSLEIHCALTWKKKHTLLFKVPVLVNTSFNVSIFFSFLSHCGRCWCSNPDVCKVAKIDPERLVDVSINNWILLNQIKDESQHKTNYLKAARRFVALCHHSSMCTVKRLYALAPANITFHVECNLNSADLLHLQTTLRSKCTKNLVIVS